MTDFRSILILALLTALTLFSACTAQNGANGPGDASAPPAESASPETADITEPEDDSASPDTASSSKPPLEEEEAALMKADETTKPSPTLTPTPKPTPSPTPRATPTPAPTPDPTPTPEPTPEPEAYVPTASDASACIGSSVSSLYAAIGYPPGGSSYASSCLGDGEDGELYYTGFTVYTYRENGSETVQAVF